MRPVRVGIISFAHVHAPAYANHLTSLPGAALAGIADPDGGRGRAAARRYGTRFYRDRGALLRAVDAVVVCSENARHAGDVLAAAAAGVPVLCEKPLAATLADAQRMVAGCAARGVQMQTAFPVRYHPAVTAAREAIAAGHIGRVLAMRGTNRGRMPPGWFQDPALAGGGAAMDHTVHVVDLMRYLSGAEVTSVYAEVGTLLHDTAVDDAALLSLELAGGIIASHDASWSRPEANPVWGDVTLEVVGTGGVLHLDLLAQHLDHIDARAGRLVHAPWGDDWDRLMLRDFVTAVAEGRPVSVPGEDGLRATEVALAAYRSAAAGRPVPLPLG